MRHVGMLLGGALLVLGWLAGPVSLAGQNARPDQEAPTEEETASATGSDRFAGLDWLVGEWQGYGLFADDTTFIHKRYSYEVGGRFLVERTLDMFPPARPSTEFEVHQDMTVFYRTEEGYRAKGFFVEGFVWNSEVEIRNEGGVIFVSTTAVENGPPGTRARYTVERTGQDAFEATFEIAWPDQDFDVFEQIHMRRASKG